MRQPDRWRASTREDAPQLHADEHLEHSRRPRRGSREVSGSGIRHEHTPIAAAEVAQEEEEAAEVAQGEEGEAETNRGSLQTGSIYPPPRDTDYASTSCCAGC